MRRLSSFEGKQPAGIMPGMGMDGAGRRISGYEGAARRPGFGPANRMPGYMGLNADSTEQDIRNFRGLLTYQVTLTNSDPATRTARLAPAGEADAAGLIATGPFDDVDGNAGLSGSTTSHKSIEAFVRFITFNPTKLLGLKISSTDEDQSEETINASAESPFRPLEGKVIPLSQYSDGGTFNAKKTFVNLLPYDMQLDGQADIKLPVVGSSTCKILFFIGPILNTAQILDANTKGL